MKDLKLTKAQEQAYQKIIDYIKFAKECETFKEYEIKEHLKGQEYRPDYDELLKFYTKEYEDNEQYHIENYLKYYIDAKENNIALTSNVSSSTLRVLEKKGLIEIIEDGKNYVDKVKLIKEV